MLIVSYFCISTELRFLNDEESNKVPINNITKNKNKDLLLRYV